MTDKTILKSEEKAIFALRSLYGKYGYLPFKMSKFEEYELYVRNKDFLISDRIITFTDTNGKLMALKPDVTLSIIKNGEDKAGCKQKVYYNENVYRVSGSTHQFKEIMQTGLECIGDIGVYDIFEVIELAAKSLATVSPNYVLEISHNGILAALLGSITDSKKLCADIVHCISEKNPHDLARICKQNGISDADTELLCAFTSLHGSAQKVICGLRSLPLPREAENALCQLDAIIPLIQSAGLEDKVKFDLSVSNDMNYYNGIVFKGFLNGICESVLSGGQYDKLMRRMGRKSGAIGFAIYLDLLEGMDTESEKYDIDVLLLYDAASSTEEVYAKVKALTESGMSVSAQNAIPDKLRYRTLEDMRKEER